MSPYLNGRGAAVPASVNILNQLTPPDWCVPVETRERGLPGHRPVAACAALMNYGGQEKARLLADTQARGTSSSPGRLTAGLINWVLAKPIDATAVSAATPNPPPPPPSRSRSPRGRRPEPGVEGLGGESCCSGSILCRAVPEPTAAHPPQTPQTALSHQSRSPLH